MMDAQSLMNILRILDEEGDDLAGIPVSYQYGDSWQLKSCRRIHVERDRYEKVTRIILQTIKQKNELQKREI
jgi:hypothetical protein